MKMNRLIDRVLCLEGRYRCVLFDYDSTIARVPILWSEARVNYRRYLGRIFPALDVPQGERVDEMETLALSYAPDESERIFQYRFDLESELDGAHEPIESTVSLIRFLQSKGSHRLFIVSNNLNRTVLSGLTQFGLYDAFEKVLGVDDVGVPKPAIDAFQVLARQASITAAESVFVGDNDRTDGAFCAGVGMTYLNINHLDRI
jgi:HAD superfamily hydrolase (TIGR01509 family)